MRLSNTELPGISAFPWVLTDKERLFVNPLLPDDGFVPARLSHLSSTPYVVHLAP